MSLANGTHYLAIPGPSVSPEEVLRAMHRTAPNIYTGALHEMVDTIVPDLKRVARTEHAVAMYIANGHGVWEAALTNVLSRGDKVVCIATGRFGEMWGKMAEALGVEVEFIDFGRRSAVAPERLAEALTEDSAHQIKAVMVVQVDTATSVRNDIPALRKVLDETGHPALLMSDNIACLACDHFEMDAWGVDVMVTGSQKGLMVPPGMGFVYFSPKADAARDSADLVTPYWDWRPRTKAEFFYQYFFGTAPTHHLHGLRAALDMLMEEGMDTVWRRHSVLASAVWAAVDRWGADGPLELNIADRTARSHAVTAVRAGGNNGALLQDWVKSQAGVTLGIGLGMDSPEDPRSEGFFRIGHMGHVNLQMVMGCLGAIDAGLKALDIPHGDGALEAASRAMAEGSKGG